MLRPTRFTDTFLADFDAGRLSTDDLSRLSPDDVLSIRSSRPWHGRFRTEVQRAGSGKRVRYVMSTENPVGWSRDVILTKGWDLTVFEKRGRPFLYEHNLAVFSDRDTTPIGRMEDVHIGRARGQRALIGEVEPAPDGVSPFADMVNTLIAEGFLDGGSVGLDPIDVQRTEDPELQREMGLGPMSVIIVRAMLLEFSATPTPMDPDAHVMRADLIRALDARLLLGMSRGEFHPEIVREYRIRSLQTEAARAALVMTHQPFGAGVGPAQSAPEDRTGARVTELERRLDALLDARRSGGVADPPQHAAQAPAAQPAPPAQQSSAGHDHSAEILRRLEALEQRAAGLAASLEGTQTYVRAIADVLTGAELAADAAAVAGVAQAHPAGAQARTAPPGVAPELAAEIRSILGRDVPDEELSQIVLHLVTNA